MSVLNKKIQNHRLTYLRGLCYVALFVKVALKWINVTYEKWLWWAVFDLSDDAEDNFRCRSVAEIKGNISFEVGSRHGIKNAV